MNEEKTFDRVLSFTAETPHEVQEKINNWIKNKEREGKTIKIISTSLGVIKGYDDDEGSWFLITALVSFSITSALPPPQQVNPEKFKLQTKKPIKKAAALFIETEERVQNINHLP